MSAETHKANIQRRCNEPYFAERYFVGEGIDIGSGDCPLGIDFKLFPKMKPVRPYDKEHGDAQTMANITNNAFDFVYSSHCLEHLVSPSIALRNWMRILRPNGHLIVVVPDWGMYERYVWPSQFNADHKWAFDWSTIENRYAHVLNVPALIEQLAQDYDFEIMRCNTINDFFDASLPRSVDQTRSKAECAIEFVLQKGFQ